MAGYVECLVRRKQPLAAKIVVYFLYGLTAIFGVSALVTGFIGVMLGIITGVGGYVLNMFTNVEFEYLFIEKELQVEKVMARSKRVPMGTYEMNKIEIIAPIDSHQLDSYKNRKVKVKNFSAGRTKPETRYAVYCEGNLKLLITPSEELYKAMWMTAPRKVFKD